MAIILNELYILFFLYMKHVKHILSFYPGRKKIIVWFSPMQNSLGTCTVIKIDICSLHLCESVKIIQVWSVKDQVKLQWKNAVYVYTWTVYFYLSFGGSTIDNHRFLVYPFVSNMYSLIIVKDYNWFDTVCCVGNRKKIELNWIEYLTNEILFLCFPFSLSFSLSTHIGAMTPYNEIHDLFRRSNWCLLSLIPWCHRRRRVKQTTTAQG